MNKHILRAILAALAIGFSAASIAPAAAQAELEDGPKSLIIQYRAELPNRVPFRRYLVDTLAPKLRAMKARGELADFRIFYSWYRQPAVWDGLVILRFPTFDAVRKWNALEQGAPGGLDARGMTLADPVASYSSDLSWGKNEDDLLDGQVYYVIPYEYLTNADEYRDYVKAYVLPQFDGWIKNGALTGYELYMNRYGTGSPWDALFIQHYRDMGSFGQRQKLTASTRVTLRDNAEWKVWSDKKQSLRSEAENSIAELIAH
ncbi:hypothetical protein M9978_05875 [Sphingomonas sp. MG17]|uniref:NIPSNAP protein n=1 Tax=Sphingomonas tagetis TaxID=2949092 RepID=A0A9X2HHZ7_9SPHN|nr:hypothetical protein [Sphingomonas tagetis]MCP3729952.1 hypothetical protein [Sphingomonas tagetis]